MAYRGYCITVPRQSGKTTLILPKLVARCLSAPLMNVIYTAQTYKDAKKKFIQEQIPLIQRSPAFVGMFKPNLGGGEERVTWTNGSRHSIAAVTEKAGHGGTVDEAVIDEAFAQVDDRVEQAMRPAMATKPDAQLGVISTAGESAMKSPYLWDKVQSGRSRVDAGQTSGFAYFEFSDDPDSDPDDEDNWFTFMPALGHTITVETVRADRDALADKPAEWNRAYRNIWPGAATVIQAIPADAWAACEDPAASIQGRTLWSVDVSADRAFTAIGAAGYTEGGREFVEPAAYRQEGTRWAVPYLKDLAERTGHGSTIVAVDAAGPAGSLIPDLEDVGFTVLRVSMREKAQACGALYDAAVHVDASGRADRLVHRGQSWLNDALAAANKHRLGDVWEWSRGASLADITPLVAVTLARWALTVSEVPWEPSAFA
jgi:hypothetical protein